MESKTLTLDELTNLFDDVNPDDVAVEAPDTYADAPAPAPIAAGKYGVQLISLDLARDMNGEIRSKKDFVADVKIADPETAAGRVVRFLRISAESKKRRDGAVEKKYSELGDLVRAFDATFNWQNSPEMAVRFLLEKIADNAIGYVYFDWKAWDNKLFEERGGPSLLNGTDEKRKLYTECSVRGMKRFDKDGTVVNAASGNVLKARVFISRTFPAKV